MMAIQVTALDEGGAETHITLFATPNHPFWVETSFTDDGKHWLAAECLEAGMGLQLADGRRAEVAAAAPIRRTQHEGVFFAADDRVNVGQLLCLQSGQLQLAPAALEASLGAAPLQLGEPYLAPVYNFEVDEFHTYYVGGGAGVWVHNTECKAETAAAMAMDQAELSKPVGEQNPIFCFAAGTLVHAKQGLVPIEQIKVGDWVLSKHENGGGEQAYKRVTRTIKSEEKVPIAYLEYFSEFSDKIHGLFVTNGHPFFVKNFGWSPAIEVIAPDELVSFNGIPVKAFECFVLWRAPEEGVAVGFGRINDGGLVIDFKNDRREIIRRDGDESYSGGRSSLWCETVYNLEVEDFHTYYVGELGVWVHNMSCDTNAAIADVSRKVELEKAGFDDETPVHVDRPNQYGDCVEEIQYIEVGDRVLSRCEKTGEMAYKRVLKKFSHGLRQQYMLSCYEKIEGRQELRHVGPLYATEEHPFWVQGKGWVAVRDLKAGDVLLSCEGAYTELRHISKAGVHEVWNLEVEDFHTYFVTHTGIWVHNENAPVEISSQPMAHVKDAPPEWPPLFKSVAELRFCCTNNGQFVDLHEST